jgi:hypothetical protein
VRRRAPRRRSAEPVGRGLGLAGEGQRFAASALDASREGELLAAFVERPSTSGKPSSAEWSAVRRAVGETAATNVRAPGRAASPVAEQQVQVEDRDAIASGTPARTTRTAKPQGDGRW